MPASQPCGTLARARVLRKWNCGTLEGKYLTALDRSHSLTVGILAQRLIGTLVPASHRPTVPHVPPRAPGRASPGARRAVYTRDAQGRLTGRAGWAGQRKDRLLSARGVSALSPDFLSELVLEDFDFTWESDRWLRSGSTKPPPK